MCARHLFVTVNPARVLPPAQLAETTPNINFQDLVGSPLLDCYPESKLEIELSSTRSLKIHAAWHRRSRLCSGLLIVTTRQVPLAGNAHLSWYRKLLIPDILLVTY